MGTGISPSSENICQKGNKAKYSLECEDAQSRIIFGYLDILL